MDRKLPPFSIESEMSVLGAIFLDNECIDTVHSLLSADDFYRQNHRLIFNSMVSLAERNEPIDLVSMVNTLKAAGSLEECGGGAFLATLVDYVPTAANVAYYCRQVVDRATERRVLERAQSAIDMIHEGKTSGEVIEHLESISGPMHRVNDPVCIGQSITESIQRIERRYETKGKLQGISFGLTGLDSSTSGMHRGELIVIAGRPSMGKSALALNVINSVCSDSLCAMLFSLEMARADNMDRMLASNGNIQYTKIRNGWLTESDWPKCTKAFSEMYNWNLFIDDTPGVSLREIKMKAKRQKKNGLDLVVVDYLQLMSMPGKESRTQAIGEVSRGLKQLARELDVPVIALSQLSRSVDARQDKRPLMSDLRDSGEIEQDADVILFPFRPSAYCQLCKDRVDDDRHNYQDHQAKAEVIIEKQRNGPRNVSIPLVWLGEYQKFVDVSGCD